MGPEALAQVLRPLQALFPPDQYPEGLVGLRPSDDAAVYRLSDDLTLVATLDFFTPIVDDPYTFGAIAAANALSDVYAMGGRPILAWNIACLSGCLPPDVVSEVLRGGADKVREAGAALVGGHSIDDSEPKYGLVALGLAKPAELWTKGAVRPGDRLVLTKPLGVGVIATAQKRDRARPADYDAAVQSMLRLSRDAVEPLHAVGVRACTDVTGFALLGHASEMAERSGVTLRLDAPTLPLLPGAEEYADAGLVPGGTKRNEQAFGGRVILVGNVPAARLRVLYTPETSGGLLAAVPPERVGQLVERLQARGVGAALVGEALPRKGDTLIELHGTGGS